MPDVNRWESPQKRAADHSAFWYSLWLLIGIIAVVGAGIYAALSMEPPPLIDGAHVHNEFARWIEFSSIMSVGLLLVAFELFRSRLEHHGFEDNVQSYDAMIHIFSEASERIRRRPNQRMEVLQTILTELGANVLAANSHWAGTHNSRPPEPPLG
jgi:hypothetical protein